MLTVPKLAHQPQLKKTNTLPPSLYQHSLYQNLVPSDTNSNQKPTKMQLLSPDPIKGKENIPITKN